MISGTRKCDPSQMWHGDASLLQPHVNVYYVYQINDHLHVSRHIVPELIDLGTRSKLSHGRIIEHQICVEICHLCYDDFRNAKGAC